MHKEEEEADPDRIVQIGSNRRAEQKEGSADQVNVKIKDEKEKGEEVDEYDSHPPPEPRNAGGSDSQGAAGGNDKEAPQDGDLIVLPTKEGSADQVNVKIKDKKEKGKEVKASSEAEQWKIKYLKRAVKLARAIYKDFLYDEDQNELQEIDASINEVDPDNVDGVTLAHLMKRIGLLNRKAKKQSDAYNLKEKDHVSKVLQTGLEEEAKERHAEAKRTADEAKKVNELVSDFHKNITRLKQQQYQVPTKNIKQKMDMGLCFLEVLEQMKKDLPVAQQNYHDFVTIVDGWNKELMDDTFWERLPSKTERTKLERQPVLDYDNVKVERFIFNPLRTRLHPFIESFRDRACDHPQFGHIQSKEGEFETILKCFILQYQTTPKKQPPRWLIVELQHEQYESALHIRSDNMYIGGFSNKQKQIYELTNANNPQVLKGSLPFGCDNDYISLMDYGNEVEPPLRKVVVRLKELVLNNQSFVSDIIAMSEYDHTKKEKYTAEDWKNKFERVQMALGRSAIVFPELCRFTVLLGLVGEGWLTIEGSHLTDLLIEYIWHWRVMSARLRSGNPFTEEQTKNIKMIFAFEAFKVLFLVLNTKGGGIVKENKSKGDGPGPVNEGKTSDDRDSNDSHPPPEPRNAGGSDSQGAAGENDKEPPQDGGGKSTVSSILSLQGVVTCSNIIGPTALEEISTVYSRMKGVINDLLRHDREEYLVKDRLFAIASSAMSSELSGQPLVEVFAVCTNSPFVKRVSIYDDRSGKAVYNSKKSDAVRFFENRESWLLLHPEMESSDYMERLVITGPGRAMSAWAGFIIEVDVDDPEGVFDLSCSWEDTPCVDEPISQTIFTSRGKVLVTTAVMSNAVQASIEFMLVSPLFSSRTSILVSGQLAIQIENFGTSIFMFVNHERRSSVDQCVEWEDEDFDEGLVGKVPLTWNDEDFDEGLVGKVPLTRNVFALPADRGFRVTGHLFLSNEDTKVYIDQYVEAKHLLGELCIWPVHQVCGSHAGKIHKHVHLPPVIHAAIRIKTTCPF